jgi:Zn-dependent protease
LHFTFLLLLGWLAIAAYRGEGPGRWYGLLYVIGIFACVVLHELGHSLVAQRYGIHVSEIILYPIGGVARLEKLPKPAQELWIALAGPAVNVLIATAIYIGLQTRGALIPWEQMRLESPAWWQKLLLANVILVVFNMIPAFPMDGGRVLRALLALQLGELRATEIAAGIGQLFAIAIGFLGLLFNPLLLFIAFFVFVGAGQEAMMYRGKALVEGLPVRAAMITEFRTLPVNATLEQAKDLLLATSQQDFPVMHGDEVVGLLSRQALLRGFAEHGPTGYVAGSMARDFPTVSPDQDLEDIAPEVQSGNQFCILVMENGNLVGMITPENLAELLVIQQLKQREKMGTHGGVG